MRVGWTAWGRRAARRPQRSRPLVVQAVLAARAAQATGGAWGVIAAEAEPVGRGVFDARRAHAWQAIDATLTELRQLRAS